jgi:hypothetical protein
MDITREHHSPKFKDYILTNMTKKQTKTNLIVTLVVVDQDVS